MGDIIKFIEGAKAVADNYDTDDWPTATNIPAGQCWFKHNWTLWGKPVHGVFTDTKASYWAQNRVCLRCGEFQRQLRRVRYWS